MQTMLDCYFEVILLILSEVILLINSCFHVIHVIHVIMIFTDILSIVLLYFFTIGSLS